MHDHIIPDSSNKSNTLNVTVTSQDGEMLNVDTDTLFVCATTKVADLEHGVVTNCEGVCHNLKTASQIMPLFAALEERIRPSLLITSFMEYMAQQHADGMSAMLAVGIQIGEAIGATTRKDVLNDLADLDSEIERREGGQRWMN